MTEERTEKPKFDKIIPLLQRSKEYAIECHRSTNHMYGDHPYEYHLQMVVDVAEKFYPKTEDSLRVMSADARNVLLLIPAKDIVLAACWCHDVIKDCRQTYNDVLKNTHPMVADIVYALTNEKGRNRKERANEKYYEGIRKTPFAQFVKYCDRIAKVEYSKKTGSSMYKKYQQENNEDFIEKVGGADPGNMCEELAKHLRSLFEDRLWKKSIGIQIPLPDTNSEQTDRLEYPDGSVGPQDHENWAKMQDQQIKKSMKNKQDCLKMAYDHFDVMTPVVEDKIVYYAMHLWGEEVKKNIKQNRTYNVPYRCPVCAGSGLVPNGFYSHAFGFNQGGTSSSSLTEQCRQCSGMGIIWGSIEHK